MLSTLATYQMMTNNLSKWQSMTQSQPDVKTATDYYQKNIGSVKSIDDLMKNDRLFNYAMESFGLGDMTYAKGLMRKVLEGGVTDPKSLANTMSDTRFKAFATAFDFTGQGATVTSSKAVTTDVVSNYVQQTTEENAGQQNDGVRLALYFQRKASSITSPYQILADKALLTVAQTALGISPNSSMQDIDQQANALSKQLNMADLQDPKKVQAFIQKFAVRYDMNNNTLAQDNPAVTLLTAVADSTQTMSSDLLMSLQGLRLGG